MKPKLNNLHMLSYLGSAAHIRVVEGSSPPTATTLFLNNSHSFILASGTSLSFPEWSKNALIGIQKVRFDIQS